MENQDTRAGTLRLKYNVQCFYWLQVDKIVQTFGGDGKAR